MLEPQQEQQLVDLLRGCQPGHLSHAVFAQLARLVVSPLVELVCLRQHEGHDEVLLLRRAEDDPVWPGLLHSPGSILRPGDGSLDDVLERLYQHELQGRPAEVRPCGQLLHESERGPEWAHVFCADRWLSEPRAGQWMALGPDLEAQLIPSQRPVVQLALRTWQQR